MYFIIILFLIPFIAAHAQGSEEYSMGKIEWTEKCQPLVFNTGLVRVTDSDMDLDPNAQDKVEIKIWSDVPGRDVHSKIIPHTAIETGNSTGIFDSTIFWGDPQETLGHRVPIWDGSTVTAMYVDDTLPQASSKANVTSSLPVKEVKPIYKKSHNGTSIYYYAYGPCTMQFLDDAEYQFAQKIAFVFPSPLKQLAEGIPLEKIKCEEGFILILKSSDDSPACVTPDTKQRLVERGWAQKIVSDYPKMSKLGNTKKQDAIASLNCGKSLDEIQSQTPFDIKTPKLLPEGYSLRNTDNAAPGIILLFYADGNVCGDNAQGLDDGVIEIVIAFSPDGDDNEASGDDFLNHYKAKYEKNNVDYKTNVTRNGLYMIGTGEGKGKTTVIDENDDIIREEEFDDPARVRVLDTNSGAGYLFRAFMPLDDLMKIAQSLS